MAAVPVVIKGTILTKAPKGGEDPSGKQQCEIRGLASIEGLEIGGGPIIPPDQQPPGGPNVPPHPAYPIWGPPGINFPDRPGYPPVAGHPLPTPPDLPPDSTPIPGWEAKVGWTEETGWFVIIVPKEGTPVPTPSK